VGAGDAFAFSALHDRHSRVTYSLARRLSGDDKDAEDLAQEAFLRACLVRFTLPSPAAAW
jgi:DNA-directed RNA polymerase specialized sigma24 family protein